ncbi:UNVERIFIED_CONTAM: hypothetical protein Slati_2909900 [Sesamum latifolium]|uniref:Uncharacterized protein n=1 Tax=Sesamum latifolium TaxID=2727402 RepID=A0AAW2VGB2_9LAMI
MSKNPLIVILEANIFNGINYNDWLQNLRIVLDFENQTYVLDRSLSRALPEESTHEERLTFEKWHEKNRKVRSIVLVSMTNDIQKQYDRHDDVQSIMLCMSQIYAVPDRHIRYAAIKAFFSTKMIEGSSVQEHGVKMLALVEKLKDLSADLAKETYIDVILQSLPPSFDSFIVIYTMNEFDKDLHELINMLVQYETTIEKSAPSVLVGASTSKVKGKGAGHCRRQKGKTKSTTVRAKSTPVAPLAVKLISANGLQVVNRSRRLRQTVLKLSNGRAIATLVGFLKYLTRMEFSSMEFFFRVPQLNGVSDKEGNETYWTWFDCSFTKLPWPMWHGKPISYNILEYMGWSCIRQGTSRRQTRQGHTGYDSSRERVWKELDSFPYHRAKLSKTQSLWTDEELKKVFDIPYVFAVDNMGNNLLIPNKERLARSFPKVILASQTFLPKTMISRPQLAQVAGQRASDLVSSRPASPKSATWQARDLRASDLPPLFSRFKVHPQLDLG